MKLLLVLSFMSLVCARNYGPLKVHYNITDGEYGKLPTLFHFDDFDGCLSQSPTLYCYTTFQLTPIDVQNASITWRNIQEIIDTPRMYRHDKLRHGICLPLSYPEIPAKMYSNGNGSDVLWKELSRYYSDKLHFNGINAQVTDMYCQDKHNNYEIDYVDIIYAVTLLCLLFIIIISTFYDKTTKPTKNTNSMTKQICTAFSLAKNWERLTTASKSDLSESLKCFQGVRVYNTMLVVLSHTAMCSLMGPVQNTKFTEDSTLNPAITLLSNGSLICQTYFVISAWLLSYSFFSTFENKRVTWRDVLKIFMQRYYRLAPMVLFSIGFSATWLRHFGDGPFWHKYVDNEFKNCRNNWLLNLLFVQNYVNTNALCLQQSWYIACEMQCFTISLFILMSVINKPKYIKKIFATVLITGILISIGHNYYMDYDIVYRSYSETLYSVYLEMEQWADTFVAGHIAFPGYVQGLIFGYFFYKFRKSHRLFTFQSRIHYWTWSIMTIVISVGIIIVASLFYKEGFQCSRFEAALYQGLYRSIFALAMGQLLFVIIFGGGGVMTHFVTWKPFQMLARLTFSIYLTHVWFMRYRYGIQRSPPYLTNVTILTNYISDLVMAVVLGTVVCLCIEMPLSAFDKIIFSSKETPVERSDKLK